MPRPGWTAAPLLEGRFGREAKRSSLKEILACYVMVCWTALQHTVISGYALFIFGILSFQDSNLLEVRLHVTWTPQGMGLYRSFPDKCTR